MFTWHPPCGTCSRKAFWLKVPSLGRGGLARLACRCIDVNAMARLLYALFIILLVLSDVTAVMATRRKPKRRPIMSDDGGDRGATGPGPASSSSAAGTHPVDASQTEGYRYCNDTVSATGGSLAARSESLPVHGDLSGDRTPQTGSQTIVELTWQTAAARLTLQTDSPAMVEAAEWSAAVSQAPPPAQPSRSMAAEQVADRVAGLLLVLEGESSPSIAGTIESILQPLVAEYGDAVLYDLIGGIMQAMSRRGISEQRQRSMVAMLMFSLADPTAPLRMASASPGGHTLSPIWCQTPGLPSGCIRSGMTGASMSALSCPWLSSRWHRALCDTQFCRGSWCIHACFVHRCARCTEHAKYKRQPGMHRVCKERRCWFTCRCGIRDALCRTA